MSAYSEHLGTDTIVRDCIAGPGWSSEQCEHEAADRVHVFVLEHHAERFAYIIETSGAIGANSTGLLPQHFRNLVASVRDISHDFLEEVFQCNDAGTGHPVGCGVLEVAVSVVLLAGTIWFVRRLAGRIFEIGMLMYGTEPTMHEMLRWASSRSDRY